MESFWHELWAEHRIGFHRDTVHPDLTTYYDRALAGGRRVLVPLCGKTLDMPHLVERGFDVVGVELVPLAVDEFHAENDLRPTVSEEGAFRVYRSKGLTIYCGDFFELSVEQVGEFDRIWDRAALVALDGERRQRYVGHLKSLAAPSARMLQSTIEYDQQVMSGPPWSVSVAELQEHYGPDAVAELYRTECIAEATRWREMGHDTWVHSGYVIELE